MELCSSSSLFILLVMKISGTYHFLLHSVLKSSMHQLYVWASKGTSNAARQIRELQDAIATRRLPWWIGLPLLL
ncbi:unnamed protein product [Linum trigynum]|uniref:Uncharacterized protein n=1 Tax=Linum trigynum TaxID=586398 RepID=A0AAV2D905_9ROSI